MNKYKSIGNAKVAPAIINEEIKNPVVQTETQSLLLTKIPVEWLEKIKKTGQSYNSYIRGAFFHKLKEDGLID